MSEEARLEKRLAWLQSLSQQDRDFIARFGEQKWRQYRSCQEFKAIQVEESKHKTESTQARKKRLLDRIEREQKTLGDASSLELEILEMWSVSGFFEIMANVWDTMVENMYSTSKKPPNRVTFCLSWVPTGKPNEYNIKMDLVIQPVQAYLEKYFAEKEAEERAEKDSQ
jgi:hypothetical protein